MIRFRDLKLGTKQVIAFAVILVLMAAANIYSIYEMRLIKTEIDMVSKNSLPRAIAIANLNFYTASLRAAQLQHAITEDELKGKQQSITMIGLIDKINANIDTYESLRRISDSLGLYTERERILYESFNHLWGEYQDLSFTFFKHVRVGETKHGLELLNENASSVFDRFSADLVQLVAITERNSIEAADHAGDVFQQARLVTATLLLISVILSALIATGLVRIITMPVHLLQTAASAVAKGNLNVRVSASAQDEIGSLSNSFNQMTNALRAAREKTQQQATELHSKNTELESKNADLQKAMDELRSAQQQLLMKEKMASLGDLVAGVTHEINNPIGAINSASDASIRCLEKLERIVSNARSIPELLADKQLIKVFNILKENLVLTQQGGHRIADIIQILKNFARLDESDHQMADLHEGIESSLSLLQNSFHGRIQIEREFGAIPRILCYPGELNQMFLNLLKNAASAIQENGTIWITTQLLPDYKGKEHICIQVKDTGGGISKDKLSRLFEFDFSQDEDRVKMSSGLVTAYNIVQRHSGEIDAQSELKLGTTITIRLPVIQSDEFIGA